MSVQPYLSETEQRASAILLTKLGPVFPNLTIERCWVNFAAHTITISDSGQPTSKGVMLRGTAIIDVPGGGGLSHPYYGTFGFYSRFRQLSYDDIETFLTGCPEWYDRAVLGIMGGMSLSGLPVKVNSFFTGIDIDRENTT